MTAPTTAVEWLLARAAVRATGLLHVVSRRDSGALNPLCGANPIRSKEVEEQNHLDDASRLCEGCGTLAMSLGGGSVIDGVAMLLGLATSTLNARLIEVPIDEITVIHEARVAGGRLVSAVKRNGVVTPVVLRRVGRGLMLLDGGRRLNAARSAGLTVVPAVVQDLDDRTAARVRLSSNLHRQDLDPIAQATAYRDELQHFDSITALADELGLSRPAVSNSMRLLRLPTHVQTHVAEGRLSVDQARELLALSTEEQDAAVDAMLEQRTRPAATRGKADPALAAIAESLKSLLAANVRVTRAGDRATIRLDVPEGDLARIVEQLGRLGVTA